MQQSQRSGFASVCGGEKQHIPDARGDIWVLKVRDENAHDLGCQSEYRSLFLGFTSADDDWRFLVCVWLEKKWAMQQSQ
jgi:hypothetical protein